MRPKLKEAVDNIVDTITGADGGVDFVSLLQMLEAVDEQGANENTQALAILEVVYRFSRLCTVARTSGCGGVEHLIGTNS